MVILEDNPQFLDQYYYSHLDSGSTITVINNDVVSHKFVSGAIEFKINAGTTDYDNFLIVN